MNLHTLIFGKLTASAFQHDPIAMGGAVTVVLVIAAIIFLLTYLKRWKWLWKEWLTSLDPKKIGVMYLIMSGLMLVRGGIDALMMRTQQALSTGASQGILGADHFQQVFSSHGTIMIFFVAMGLMFGLFNLVIPVQIGSRDVAFPVLNSLSFWLFVSGAILVNVSLVLGVFSNTGWLAYPPLSELAYSPTVGVDYWIWALQIAGIGSLLSGINFFVTCVRKRAKGMTLWKMPLFTWSVLGTTVLIIFAFPILTATLSMLFLDRTMGMHFFTAVAGGNMMMYVNLIWTWGHPEVYILVLPAFGVFSEVVSTFSRKKLAGYKSMVLSICAISFFSFIVWMHHFFTMGAGADVNAFFGIMTMIIAIPTGVKIFNWLFTMYKGRVQFTTPMLWFVGFVILFTIGGVTGVLLAVPPADFQFHNSLFLVAHFHTMIVAGVLFGYFAGITYWFPKIFGFKLNEKIGRRAFWCWFVGFILAFGPLFLLGLMGATRRLDHYSAGLGWQPLFIVAGIGAAIIALGVAFQIWQIIVSIRQRKQNLDTTGDPWNGRTLEWALPSPVPSYNFPIDPVVYDRDEWWAVKHLETPVTKPAYKDIYMPKNTPTGLFIAIGAFLLGFGMVWHIWWLVLAALIASIICAIAYALKGDEKVERVITAEELEASEAQLPQRLHYRYE